MALLPLLGNTPNTRLIGPDVWYDQMTRHGRFLTRAFCAACGWHGDWNTYTISEQQGDVHLCNRGKPMTAPDGNPYSSSRL